MTAALVALALLCLAGAALAWAWPTRDEYPEITGRRRLGAALDPERRR